MWMRPFSRHLHGSFEPLPLTPADDLSGRHTTIVEDDICGVRATLPHLAVARADC